MPPYGAALSLLVLTSSLLVGEGVFQVYWNVPLEVCTAHGVTFDLDQFSIVHNTGNTFYGDEMNIFYGAGLFPQYDRQNLPINGGIPQQGNLTTHIEHFVDSLQQILPQNYSGPAVLDFETYLPSYRVSLPALYQRGSEQWVRRQHPHWREEAVKREAERTFDQDVRPYFESLLRVGLNYRPNALLGYYHYPYCHNYHYPYTHCQQEVMDLNDQLSPWLLTESSALYPSVYTFHDGFDDVTRYNVLSTRLTETERVNKAGRPVLPYFWYRYHENPEFLSLDVARAVLWVVRSHNTSGVVVWGSKYDLRDRATCLDFKSYLYSTLGPLLKCFQDLPDTVVQSLKDRYPIENKQNRQQGRNQGPSYVFEEQGEVFENNIYERVEIREHYYTGDGLYNEFVEQTDIEREMEDLERDFVQEHNMDVLMNMIRFYCKSLNLE